MRRVLFLLIAVGVVAVLIVAAAMLAKRPTFAPILGLQQSGHAFPMGASVVNATYGYYGNGDRLAFAVIRIYPPGVTTAAISNDTQVDLNTGGVPLVADADGNMRYVRLDGVAYLIDDDGVQTFRIEMDEHTDTVGLSKCTSKAEMVDYLQGFSP